MHQGISPRLGLTIVGTVLVFIALGFWVFDWSVKVVAVGAHVVLIGMIVLLVWSRHRTKASSGPSAT